MKKYLAATLAALVAAFAFVPLLQSQPYYQGANVTNATGLLRPANGGTGVANANTKTITLGGPLVTSGAFTTTITSTGTTGITLPTSGTVCASGNQCTATSFAPSTTSGIIGTATNDSAAAGSVGQFVESYVTGQTVTTSLANLTSISLTAGDWDVSAVFESGSFGPTNVGARMGISTTSGALSGSEGKDWIYFSSNTTHAAASGSIPRVRVSVNSTTTIYLVVATQNATITTAANGYLTARRMR